ncbi:MAG: hypothetical protein ABIS86_22375 [Streptosporangiaceae bacterium]
MVFGLKMSRPPRADGDNDSRVDDAPDGPTASHAGAMLSALFLLIFAIAIIIPWTVADSARQNTQVEAQALVEAYWSAGDLPAADAGAVRAGIGDYATFVVDTEWTALARGHLDDTGWTKLDGLRSQVDGLSYTDKELKATQDDVGTQLQSVYEARRQRAVDAQAGLPAGVLWLTVVTGIIIAAFPFLAGARPRGLVWVPWTVMVVCLTIGVVLVFAIDQAFSGPLGVGPDAYRTALQEFTRIP